MMKRWMILWLCLLSAVCTACEAPTADQTTSAPTSTTVAPVADPLPTTTAVKAVWVPFMEVNELLSSEHVPTAETAIAACMEDCRQKGFNTVYFHVRANSDAYYGSTVFTPHPKAASLLAQGFDPLAYAVEQAHARGLELHAWVNPYRIGADASYARCADIFEYGGKWYYDPSSETVRSLVVDGVRELVTGYSVDGVQFDDYFYPDGAVTASGPSSFEEERFVAYQTAGGRDSVSDWRRCQVSALVAAVRSVCHEREGCLFGISPAYNIDHVRDNLYADVEEWARTEGYVDYLCPQLYFGFQHQTASFETLLTRWCALERCDSVSLVIGLGMYKTGLAEDTYAGYGKTEWADGGDIIARQIALCRRYKTDGVALYSHQSFAVTDDRDGAVIQAETDAMIRALSQWS